MMRAATCPLRARTTATVIGSVNRLGPALPGFRNTIADVPHFAKILFDMTLPVPVPLPRRSGRVMAKRPELSQRPMRFCATISLSVALSKIPDPAHPL